MNRKDSSMKPKSPNEGYRNDSVIQPKSPNMRCRNDSINGRNVSNYARNESIDK